MFARDAGGNEQAAGLPARSRRARSRCCSTDAGPDPPPAGDQPRARPAAGRVDRRRQDGGRRENPTLDLTLVDPLGAGEAPRKIATLPGTGWGDFTFSFDDRRLAMIEFKSVNETYVWVMDLATGAAPPRAAAPQASTRARSRRAEVKFSRDGKGLFLTTDRDGEFQRAAYLDLATGKLESFGAGELGRRADRAVARRPRARAGDQRGGRRRAAPLRRRHATRAAAPAVPIGTVSGVQWHDNSRALAFELDRAQSPGDVYVLDVARQRRHALDRDAASRASTPARFAAQQPIDWKSFDGRTISGFLTRPPAKFTGKRPGDDPDPRRARRPGAAGLPRPLELLRRTSWASPSSSPTCAARPATARPSSRSTTA